MQEPRSEMRDASKLKAWEKNPRTINNDDFERLKAQIKKLGAYKPLVITEDGTVIGGNMRLKALTSLGAKKIWCSVVEAKDEAAMLEYALSDNDQAGRYDDVQLAELVTINPIESELFKVDLSQAVALAEMPSLADGNMDASSDDKSDFSQVTFTLSSEQAETVQSALEASKKQFKTLFENESNENSNGNALYFALRDWLDGREG